MEPTPLKRVFFWTTYVVGTVAFISTLMLALGLLVPADGLGESTSLSLTADTILEVTATYYGMHCEECADRYLYLRLFSDGTAECQFSKRSAAEPKESPTIKKTLTEDEFNRIKSAVNTPKLAKVRPKYETWYGVVDTSTEWKIEIHRTDQTQVIEVLNFSPGLTKLMKHPYPSALVKLGCNVEKLRADVMGESPSLDSECKKVLGVKDQPKSFHEKADPCQEFFSLFHKFFRLHKFVHTFPVQPSRLCRHPSIRTLC